MKRLMFLMFILVTTTFSTTLELYCGSTMAKAMRQLADKFELKTGVHVNIIKGGSGKLYRTILAKGHGDLYFPGSYKFIKNDKEGIFGYKKLVGYNRAIILVKKGNPKHITSLQDFTREDVKIVLGLSNVGSVGKIAKSILTLYKDEKFYDTIYEKAVKVPTSLEIVNDIKNNVADVSINWKAAAFMGDNEKYLDFINIPYIAPKQKLYIAIIKYSKNPSIAKEFIDFVFSKESKRFMKSKGF
jgi:molybdate transport system substrate-binding protein